MKFKFNGTLAVIAVFIAFLVYKLSYELDSVRALYYSFTIFSLDIKKPSDLGVDKDPEFWKLIYISGLLTVYVLFKTVVELYIKFFKQDMILRRIQNKGNHVIVIGLGESNRVYIDSELQGGNKNIIVVEYDKSNLYLEKYKEEIGVIIGDGKDINILENANYNNCKHVVVSTANDMINIEIAMQLLSLNIDRKIFIHIEDRNLRYLYKKGGILSGKNIKVYSYYEDSARELFSKYDIDGENQEIIASNKPYAIAVVGDTAMAYEVIAQACIMGQLPNENELTIYCLDENAKKFQSNVELYFPEIMQVPNVIVKYVEIDPNSKIFYKHEVWNHALTNIIVCFEEDQKNLDISSNLINLVFAYDIADKKMRTNILLSMFDNYNLNNVIKNNYEVFRYLYSFGNINDINAQEYVISGERDKVAIAVDFVYNNIGVKIKDYDKYIYTYYLYLEDNKYKKGLCVKEKIKKEKNDLIIKKYNNNGFIETNDSNWSNLSYFQKESNRAVADQMKMKLKYLGLSIIKSDEENKYLLFKNNARLFNSMEKDELILAKMEHNRWNAFHYINGYSKINFVSKKDKKDLEETHEIKKQHMCLVDFSEFKKRKNELDALGYNSGQFEGYDFMINKYIPLILANAGYAIKKPIALGITGHIKYKFKKHINKIVEKELKKISIKYTFEEIISPLAEGADRLVAKMLIDDYEPKFIVPLPFEKNEYKKDFEEEDSKKEFDDFLVKSTNVYEVGSLKKNSREECYLNVGKEVVNECDILIALWNGKPSKGLGGGTGDVVKYAQEQNKPILHINTETFEIDRRNF